MRWKRGRRSTNVEDLRGRSTGRMRTGRPGGGRGMKLGGGAGIIVLLLGLVFGVDLTPLLGGGGGGGWCSPLLPPLRLSFTRSRRF